MIIQRTARLVVAAATAAALTSAALADSYFVRISGSDEADGRSPKTAFRTILRAARALDHGDRIVIGPGSYRESVFLADRFSADGAAMSIEGDESGKQTASQPGAVILEPADLTRPALYLFRLRNLTISGLTFQGNGQGLRLQKCLDLAVTRCSFSGLTQGLTVQNTIGLRVESSVFARCTLGINLSGTVNTRVAHVTVTGSTSAGLMALSCGAGAVRNSIFAANGSNLIADEISAPAWTSDCNVIHGTTGIWGSVPVIAKVYEWNAASGQDRHSVHVVPDFAAPANGDFHIVPTVTWAGGLPGMTVGAILEPKVEADRDGKPFRVRDGAVCAGAYDYPDPQPAPGWTKLAAKFDGPGPRQSAALYLDDGTLVRNLVADAAGLREIWWDGLDDSGQAVAAGKYLLKTATHDVRIVDDGPFGDNGNPLGGYNCDNADRIVALPDGGFVISTIYDEGGLAIRRYASTGQPIAAVNLAEKEILALTAVGEGLYGVVGPLASCKLAKFVLPGERTPMANGADFYPILAASDVAAVQAEQKTAGAYQQALQKHKQDVQAAKAKNTPPPDAPVAPPLKNYAVGGVAVIGSTAYVALAGFDVVRVIDLTNGQKQADWPVPGVQEIAVDKQGVLWGIAGKDAVAIGANGALGKRFATGLEAPRHLALSPTRIAVVDRQNARVAVLDAASGRIVKAYGKPHPAGAWLPVGLDYLVDPRGCAFLADGTLALCEHTLIRVFSPDTGVVHQEILSNFMDSTVVHPTKPEYVYCFPGAFRVDPKTGAWRWLVMAPAGSSPHGAVVLGGKPFIFYYNMGGTGSLRLVDVSDPLKPREALFFPNSPAIFNSWAYATVSFGKNGDIIAGGNYTAQFVRVKFTGLDAQGNPTFDFAKPEKLGPEKDPVASRELKSIAAIAADRVTGDINYLAVTKDYCKMVPAWGADGTGVGRSAADGRPLWFALSSGGNYQSISTVNDGKNAWILAGKSFGGQIDLFDADGLRLTTGNWNWPCNYTIGFIDLRYGVHAYLRPDGKPGAYVEDDAIGRFARCRIDGAETLRKNAVTVNWTPSGAPAGMRPDLHAVRGKPLGSQLVIPKVPELKMDGDWAPWEQAGVVPQIISLPAVTWGRSWPGDLWQTFRAGTSIGAIAHDGANFYVYFVCTDDTRHFDADTGGIMWEFDSVELWMEEEQFGLGMLKNGEPCLYKYRYHNKEGREWAANYGLPRENVWAAQIDDLSTHPLGRMLGAATGTSFQGKKGYAVAGRIPFIEVKLVGGIAGRGGKDILSIKGEPGEVLRVGIAFDGINQWGREQDFKVYWPSGLMFSDPTTLAPFVLGGK